MIMKKLFMILLSVFLVGCGVNTADYDTAVETMTEETATESADTAEGMEVTDTDSTETLDLPENAESMLAEDSEPTADEASKDNVAPEDANPKAGKDTESTNALTSDSKSEKSTDSDGAGTAADSESKTAKEKSKSASDAKQTQDKSKSAANEQKESASNDTKQKVERQSEPVSYSPDRVVSLAIAKCQSGGMVTTTDNLAALLSEGSITQEEYDEYYPYDGLGYYSVFVETDLNEAATTSGKKLESEEAIARYLADMLLLETEPIFNIEYAGITNTGGTDYYEFRCYR